MSDRLTLDTPENILVEFPIAGIGSRSGAAIIDSLIIGTLLLIATIGIMVAQAIVASQDIVAVYLIASNSILFGYNLFFELIWRGQSPGKRIYKLRVIQRTGYPVTPLATFIRNVARIVDFLPSFYGIGLITMMLNDKSCRLGDFLAGTIVVKEGRESTLLTVSRSYDPLVLAGVVQTPHEDADADLEPIRTFFLRAPDLIQSKRVSIALQLAELYDATFGGFANGSPEAYLQSLLDLPRVGQEAEALNAQQHTVESDRLAELVNGADIAKITPTDLGLIRGYFDRRASLTPERRLQLAQTIVSSLHDRIGGTMNDAGDPMTAGVEQYLAALLYAVDHK